MFTARQSAPSSEDRASHRRPEIQEPSAGRVHAAGESFTYFRLRAQGR
jgi:hypothetical protein